MMESERFFWRGMFFMAYISQFSWAILHSPLGFNNGTASSFHLFTPPAYTTWGPEGLYLHSNSSARWNAAV